MTQCSSIVNSLSLPLSAIGTVALPGRLRRPGQAGLLGELDPAECAHILIDALIKRFGYSLPVFGFAQLALVIRVGEKGDLRQNGRHVSPDQNHERSSLHAPIALPGASFDEAPVDGVLNVVGKDLRLFNLLRQ